MRIAVLGKGGSGKSVLAGTLARLFASRGHSVLTLDSDLMPGLALSLGLGPNVEAMLAGAVDKNEQGRWRLRTGIGPVRAVMRYAALAPDGVRHLQCGKLDAEGLPKIIGSVNGFYQVVHRLPRARTFENWTIIGDLPAGPRQLAYRWAPYADTYLVMVEPSWKSVLTARRIAAIIRSESPASVMPVANKLSGAADRRTVEKHLGEPLAAAIPLDPAVANAERAGLAPIDQVPHSPAMLTVETLAGVLEAGSQSARRAA